MSKLYSVIKQNPIQCAGGQYLSVFSNTTAFFFDQAFSEGNQTQYNSFNISLGCESHELADAPIVSYPYLFIILCSAAAIALCVACGLLSCFLKNPTTTDENDQSHGMLAQMMRFLKPAQGREARAMSASP